MKDKNHLTNEGFNEILSIKVPINLGLSDKLKIIFPNIIPINRPLIKFSNIPDPNWLSGFISGDGSFEINISKSSSSLLKKKE